VVGILLPRSADADAIYALGIQPACREVKVWCERIEAEGAGAGRASVSPGPMERRLAVVADMTGRDPWVISRSDWAGRLGIPLVLLVRNGEASQEELASHPSVVTYGNASDIVPGLVRELQKILDKALVPSPSAGPAIRFAVQGRSLGNYPTIPVALLTTESEEVRLTLNAFSRSERSSAAQQCFRFALRTSDQLTVYSVPEQDHGQRRTGWPRVGGMQLFPENVMLALDGGTSLLLILATTGTPFSLGRTEHLILSAFFESGTRDYPFRLRIVPPAMFR